MAEGEWNAFEAVVGAPLTQVAALVGVRWTQARQWLLELAEELVVASAEGTLPESSSLDLAWVDRDGRLKLLDAPLVPPGVHDLVAAEEIVTSEQCAVKLLHRAFELFSRNQELAPHTRQYCATLAEMPEEVETLKWAAEELRLATHRQAELKWDDRLGVLAVSMWLEMSFYTVLASTVSWVLASWVGHDDLLITGIAIVIAQLAPVGLGFVTRGGPVFHLTNVGVVGRNGLPANRWRCAWRTMIAWLPLIVLSAVGGSWRRRSGDPSTLDSSIVLALLGAELLGAWFLIGVAYAVARPQRGMQDLLAGTRLAPK
jgi:hypothetical protein